VATAPGGLPSDRDFIRGLRDHALFSGGEHGERILGLTHPPELELWSGLSRPSVSTLVDRFAAILDHQDSAGGPTPPAQARRWALDPDAGVLVAVQIGQTNRVAVGDAYGRPDATKTVEKELDSFLPREGEEEVGVADRVLEWVVRTILRLVGTRSHDDVIAVCISFTAPLDRERGVLRAPISARRRDMRATSFEEWQLMRAREQLVSRLGWDDVVFLIDNDANLAAMAEYVWGAGRWAASRGSAPTGTPPLEDMVYIEWSRGIGCGLVLDGCLYRGRGVAGEFGHTVIAFDRTDVCPGCHKKGCLESVAGWNAVFENAFGDAGSRLEPSEMLALLEPGHEGHELVAEEFEKAATNLAHVLGPVINLLNPQLVVIGGDVGACAFHLVRAPLLQGLNEFTMDPALSDVTVRPTKLGHDRTIRGAMALALLRQKDDPESLLTFLQHRAKPR
jgi:predicted NBD/HSP70 family sugar kinase